ncbi:putative (+)-borneol dehydrogenase [Helianthus annuus]|uniref:(+)-borneol dehydrogenase n=1 Tax=Helianthus annuus TaxID=4232 RepID=A0A9K3NWM3_HELAN|nr:putative (+)-borneol dehydrogenase [Helianthus annuus]KAJ0593736.1 putative (+)-borneol dehydrogenase [Helianthus annuus]KAJ0608762.1 putative (+)-borneol dehydrogenase [Helianthus annuus]KAJ0768801.1 putative (+)-borneol dehydrogenase [Helianthus annuus]KAJ0774550.1 putative (+)-borneol dehydrogenase [Helianthus annuus]
MVIAMVMPTLLQQKGCIYLPCIICIFFFLPKTFKFFKDFLSEKNVYVHVTRLMNKVAVVTGGARGIGAATAKLMAENGAHVVIADILDDLGTSLANSINGRFVHCDVSIESDVEAAVQLAITWKGRLDIMYNNAGIGGKL